MKGGNSYIYIYNGTGGADREGGTFHAHILIFLDHVFYYLMMVCKTKSYSVH
jgi:hypothetical protein